MIMELMNFFKNYFKNQTDKMMWDTGKKYIYWNDSYSVQIKELDEQHKMLFAMLNKLHKEMQRGKGKESLGPVLEGMLKYITGHFSNEEKYMEKLNYPDYETHREAHREFMKKAVEFHNNFQENKMGLSVEVMFYLKDWIGKHIKVADKKYSTFFQSNGLI